MKTKLFSVVVSVSSGGGGGDSSDLERQMNEFLSDNPGVKVIDVKLAANAAPVANTVTNYGLHALMLYED